MAEEGQVVLFRFPQTDQKEGKLRPALLLRQVPGCYNDWLVCMISSQTHQIFSATDELVSESDGDYKNSGLKRASVIRATRLAVVQQDMLEGAIGKLGEDRLTRIRINLANWIAGSQPEDAG
jgi:mRNA interferase MazF